MVEHTMDVSDWLRKQLEQASPDLLRAMVQDFAEALMGAEADALCGAGYGERSPERVNRSNGYRERDWDTRVGTIELRVPRVRDGGYFPSLLEPRRRAERDRMPTHRTAEPASPSTVTISPENGDWLPSMCRKCSRRARPARCRWDRAKPGSRAAARQRRSWAGGR